MLSGDRRSPDSFGTRSRHGRRRIDYGRTSRHPHSVFLVRALFQFHLSSISSSLFNIISLQYHLFLFNIIPLQYHLFFFSSFLSLSTLLLLSSSFFFYVALCFSLGAAASFNHIPFFRFNLFSPLDIRGGFSFISNTQLPQLCPTTWAPVSAVQGGSVPSPYIGCIAGERQYLHFTFCCRRCWFRQVFFNCISLRGR